MFEYVKIKDLIKRYNDTIKIEKEKNKVFNQNFIIATMKLYKLKKMVDEEGISLDEIICIAL